eukprot:gene8206-24943_t
MRTVYLAKWARFRFQARQNAKKRLITESLLAQSERGVKVVYWARLKHFVAREKASTLADVFSRITDKGVLRSYYHRWAKWRRVRKHDVHRRTFARALARGSETYLTRVYQTKCMDWLAQQRAKESAARISELDGQIAQLERLLAMNALTDEEIAERKARLLAELGAGSAIHQEMNALREQIQIQRMENSKIRREIVLTWRPEGATKEAEITSLFRHVKA